LHELLTDAFTGVVNCDRAKMDWNIGRPQWCWAHLQRDFQALIDDPDHQTKRLGWDLMRQTKKLFECWSRCRDGTLTRLGFQRLMTPIRQAIDGLLLRGVWRGHRRLRGICRPLRTHRQRLWTFLDVDGVEPTNNASAPRGYPALRPAVIWRKLSFGTQSRVPACGCGSRFVETILTVVETCQRQSRPCFAFLTAAIAAHFAGQPTPSRVWSLNGGDQALSVSWFQKDDQFPLRSVALRAVTARAPCSVQCMPGPLSRTPTSCLQLDSIRPVPIGQPCWR
jgi:hypothetical protein